MNNSNLLYRRQFICTNARTLKRDNWNHAEISAGNEIFHLACHKDVEFEQNHRKLQLVLIGYLLDPFDPSLTNKDIVEEMAGFKDYTEVVNRINFMNGKYVLFISDPSGMYVLNDATASKQVFYYFENDEIWLSSSPNLVLENRELDRTKNNDLWKYLESSDYRNKNKAWFGTETPYSGLYILAPNHLIDINKKEIKRFWPTEKLNKQPFQQSIDHAARILKGTIESAAQRYKLHISLTGGYDSRMILSASKNVFRDAEYYTLKTTENYEKNILDFRIPQKLTDKYNLHYKVIEIGNNTATTDFLGIFHKNSIFNRDTFADVYYTYIELNYENTINVTGVMGDQLLRAFYRFKGETTAKKIADRFKVSEYPYIVKSIDDFLSSIRLDQNTEGIHPIDWFNWEYFSANWGGVSATEHDIVREELRMVNCRELISTFMLLSDRFRYRDNPRAHKLIIKRNWPELLNIGIEPSNIQHRKLKKFLRFLHLERFVDSIYKGMKG